jgi:hypothetical protein
MYQENFGKVMEIIIGCMAFATSVINVILTYLETSEDGTYSKIFNNFDYAACCLFLISYTLKWYVATHRFQYIFSLMSVLDLFIFMPTLIMIEPTEKNKFTVLILFSRYIRSIIFFLILQRYFKLGQSDVDRQINIVFMTMVLLTYIASGMYAVVENRQRNDENRKLPKEDQLNILQFHDSVYFVIVSLATVGYGDEIPMSEFGRVIVLFIIFFTIVLIPA